MDRKYVSGHAAAMITSIIWGTTFVSTKLLMQSFTPMEILFFRFILGLTGLWIISPGKLKLRERKHEILFLLAGIVGINLFYLAENVALLYTTTSNVSVIVSAAPFFTAILARLFAPEEKLKPWFFAGCVISLGGVALLSFGTGPQEGMHLKGDLLSLAAAFLWACYSILSKEIGKLGYDEIKAAKRIFTYGIISMVPALFFMDFEWDLTRFSNAGTAAHFIYLGFMASALCFVLWNRAVAHLGAMKSSVYIYVIPVVTVLASMLILGERLSRQSGAGILLILVGLILSEKRK